jgi:hypothetical protein
MSEMLQKFWSAKYKLWITPLKPGKELPEGASILRGKGGAQYYYNAKDQPPPPTPKKKEAAPGQEQAQQDPNAAPNLYLEGLLGEKPMEDIAPEERLDQPWRAGKIAVNQVLHVPEKTREVNGVLKTTAAHDVKQTTWMLPSQYYDGLASGKEYELNAAKNDEHGIRLPTPEDPDRRHVHEGAMEPHPINEIHDDEEADIGHRDEIDRYDRAFNRQNKTNWMEKYRVKVNPSTRIKFGGKPYTAFKYEANGLKGPVYVFDSGLETIAVVSKDDKPQMFDRQSKALDYVRDLVLQHGQLPVAANLDELADDDPTEVIQRALDLLQKAEEAKINHLSEYQSGDDNVTLENADDNYAVSVNSHPLLKTDNIGEAIGKFYQEISRVIQAQTADKDVAMNIFGEKVIQTNRKVIPMLNMLGKPKEAAWVKSIDFSKITLPFNPDVLKYEPPNNVFPIVNTYDETGQGAAEGGKKPTKDIENPPVKVEPTYQMTHVRHEQDPIIEKSVSDSEIIKIGESLGVSIDLMDAFIQGYKVELEHSETVDGDKLTIGKIAKDHLKEDPEYYTKLEKVEGDVDILNKAFWAPKFNLYLYPIKAGQRLPNGAVLFRGQGGGMYYYYPGGSRPGHEQQTPVGVKPGHGVQAGGFGARATNHPEGNRMFERENIKAPYGGVFPPAKGEGRENQPVEKPAERIRDFAPNLVNKPKTPVAQDRGLELRRRLQELQVEQAKRQQERLAMEAASKKMLAEEERQKKEAEVYGQITPELIKEHDEILAAHSPNDVALTGFDKLDPEIYKQVQEYINKPINEIEQVENTASKRQEYLASLALAAEDGVLNDIAPELNGKSGIIKDALKKAEYLYKLMRPLKQVKKFKSLDTGLSDFVINRVLAKSLVNPTLDTFMSEEPVSKSELGGGAHDDKYRMLFKNKTEACFKPKTGEYCVLRQAIPMQTGYLRETVAHDIDTILNWNLVPQTTLGIKKVNGEDKLASLQEWREGTADSGASADEMEKHKLVVFDMIIGNQDRHYKNFSTDKNHRIVAFDNGLSFYEDEGKNKSGVRNYLYQQMNDKGDKEIMKIPEVLVQQVAENKHKIVSTIAHSLGSKASILALKRINHIINNKTFSDFGWNIAQAGWR